MQGIPGRRRASKHGVSARLGRGQQLVELAAGLLVLIPIFLLIIDMVVFYLAATLNDNACRDAARAASVVQPVTADGSGNLPASSPIRQRADSVVRKMQHLDGYIIGPRLVNVSLSPDFKRPTNLLLGGNFEGSVEVRTQVDYKLPATIPGILPQQVTLTSQQSFPLTAVLGPQIVPL
ncbi:MAG TPA: pilus assembly protein [Candidatus Obscuribacter sp.]|nr:pilus assembly protein [Candidatus Obscuribacter sp.]MBK9279414.1 pilus assembly protein [Candidatus Obscuribacter sp.]MBL8085092.1 pilus assembly protein [Candidatus Obscuribacter sp.]HMW90847.1 pilus assembly protein [Candidatus Obscuribacter sp.]HNA74071.1 pilus assembly protein [Candidatus Obscuribacter sp.]